MVTTDEATLCGLDPLNPIARFELSSSQLNPTKRDISYPGTGQPDFVTSLDGLRQLMRLIDNELQTSQTHGLTLHRVGDCIVLDRAIAGEDETPTSPMRRGDLDVGDPLVLLPTSLIEEISCDLAPEVSGALLDVKNTFIHVEDDGEESFVDLPRYHSAPPGGVMDSSQLQVSPPRPIKDTVMNGLLRLPAITSIPEESAQTMLPFLDPSHMSPMSRINRSVEWNVAGFSVLLGCEIVLMDSDPLLITDLSAIRRLGDNEFWPTRSNAREAWLESSLLQVHQVAWLNRERKGVELITTTNELSHEADVEGMLITIQNVLSFLYRECQTQGATYCLVRSSDGSCLLYDVTDLPKDCNVLKVSRELALPIAKVSYTIATQDKSWPPEDRRRLLRKAWDLMIKDPDAELAALIAIELSSLEPDRKVGEQIAKQALSLSEDWSSETIQRLLVATITLVIETDVLLAEALLRHVSEERKEVECKNLVVKVSELLGQRILHQTLSTDPPSSSLQSRVRLIEIPSDREGQLRLAQTLLHSHRGWHAAASNELGALLIRNSESVLEGLMYLTEALEEFVFSDAPESVRSPSMIAVLLNMANAFKHFALLAPGTVKGLVNRFRAVALVLSADKVSQCRSSLAGIELLKIGGSLAESMFVVGVELDIDAEVTHASFRIESILKKGGLIPTKVRKLGESSIFIGDMGVTETDILRSDTCELARCCIEMSLSLFPEDERDDMRPEVDLQMTKWLMSSGAHVKVCLRRIQKCLDARFTDEAYCLKLLILFKAYGFKHVLPLVVERLEHPDHDSEAIRDCLKLLAMGELRDTDPHPKARPVFEALLRGKETAFITQLVKS